MATTAVDQFATTLGPAGVKRVYNIFCYSLGGLTNAVRCRAKIEWVPKMVRPLRRGLR